MLGAAPFTQQGLSLQAEPLTDAQGPLRLVWLHGWGQSRQSLRPLANALVRHGETWLVDLPGHGTVPPPTAPCPPAAMASLVGAWLATLPPCPTIVVGHSMGFRVALHAAHQQLPNLCGIVALGGAGVPRQLSPKAKLRRWGIARLMRLGHRVKPLLGEGLLNHLRRRFGSRDYLACHAALRAMFVAVVGDDTTPLLPQIATPALLLYGADDEETPPDVGHTFKRRLPKATLEILPHLNHYTILTHGQHLVAQRVQGWLRSLGH